MIWDLWHSHARIFAYWTCLYFSLCLWVVIFCPAFCKLKPKKNFQKAKKTHFWFKNLGFSSPSRKCRPAGGLFSNVLLIFMQFQ